jgi:hypothetical protein
MTANKKTDCTIDKVNNMVVIDRVASRCIYQTLSLPLRQAQGKL